MWYSCIYRRDVYLCSHCQRIEELCRQVSQLQSTKQNVSSDQHKQLQAKVCVWCVCVCGVVCVCVCGVVCVCVLCVCVCVSCVCVCVRVCMCVS